MLKKVLKVSKVAQISSQNPAKNSKIRKKSIIQKSFYLKHKVIIRIIYQISLKFKNPKKKILKKANILSTLAQQNQTLMKIITLQCQIYHKAANTEIPNPNNNNRNSNNCSSKTKFFNFLENKSINSIFLRLQEAGMGGLLLIKISRFFLIRTGGLIFLGLVILIMGLVATIHQ